MGSPADQQQTMALLLLCLWLAMAVLAQGAAVIGADTSRSTTFLPRGKAKVVEMRDQDVPAFLLNGSSSSSNVLLSTVPAVKALINSSSGGFAKRTRRYVTPDTFNSTSSSLSDALNLPGERGGLKLSRWVICSWAVANISAEDAMRNRNNVFLERIPELLRSVQNLAPSQVYAVAAANITLGFKLTGMQGSSSLTQPATDALTQVASDMAGSYTPKLITVSTTPPGSSIANPSAMVVGGSLQEASAGVVKRGKDLGQQGPATAPPNSAGRRLSAAAFASAHQGHRAASSVLVSPAVLLPRRLLLQAAAQPAAPASSSSSSAMPIWLQYARVAPGNTTALLTELCTACNITATVPVGFDFAPQPCGKAIRAALVDAGMPVDDDKYAQILTVPPTVSLSVRLAVGMTAAQVADGTDIMLARWLSEPSTAQAVARMYAPDAVIQWLHTPEIWYQRVPYSPPTLSPAAAAGVAVGGAAFLCTVILLTAWLIHRRKRQRQGELAAAADKQDGTDSQSSSTRRRRKQGKRRYLMPEPPRPDSASTSAAAAADGAGPSTSAAAEDSLVEDTDLSPDQIRPQLRSLGDSVTSAVRFEQSDEEEGGAAAGPSGTAGPEAAAAAAAAVAAGAAAAAVGAAAAGSSRPAGAAGSSGVGASSRSVLEARAALLAEYQQQDSQDPGALSAPAAAARDSSSPPVIGLDTIPSAVSPELAAAADICSAVTPPSDSRSSLHHMSQAADESPAGPSNSVGLLEPVDKRAAAASAAAVAAASALPQSGAVAASTHRASPFMAAYNFELLAGAAPATGGSPQPLDPAAAAAALAAASAKAVALPPRRLPLAAAQAAPADSGRLAGGAAGALAGTPVQEITAAGPSPSSDSSRYHADSSSSSPTGVVARGIVPSTEQTNSSSSNSSSSKGPGGGGDSNTSMHSGASPAGTSPSSAAAAAASRPGVGLQQLVSISPRTLPGVDDDDSSRIVHATALLPAQSSACPSELGGCHETSYTSTLQLSSSMSGPVLPSNSTLGGPLTGSSFGPGSVPAQRELTGCSAGRP